MKRCGRCKLEQELSEFGFDKSRPDGLNGYCKSCIREKVSEQRKRKRLYLRGRKPFRKPCLPVYPIWRMKLKPREAVLQAIKRGASTQHEIKQATRLYPDELTDALADLYSENRLDRQALRNRRYIAA